MKRLLAITLAAPLAGFAAAQQGDLLSTIQNLENMSRPVRVPIRSADPWLIKMLLEGGNPTQPEYSTVWGVGMFGGGGMQGGFGGGMAGGGVGGGAFGGAGVGLGGGAAGGGGSLGRGGAGGAAGGGAAGGMTGGVGGGAGQARGLLPAGWRAVVNPTDNSIWLMPVRG